MSPLHPAKRYASRVRLLSAYVWCACALSSATARAQAQQADAHDSASALPLGISMAREGSGTSWQPDAAPTSAIHAMAGSFELMLHGSEFGMYDEQYGGPRGGSQFAAWGWLMGSAAHPLGGGRIAFHAMLSADPWTATLRGYPLLLQSGESYNGAPLHDRQHPHDFFGELAARYDVAVTSSVALQLYAGPAGEPALGPVAFLHRPSATDDPFAPLSHHWQDETHASFGVVTAGIYTRALKLEGSIFNGREPDQDRTDIDFAHRAPVLDSYSARLTFNPTADVSLSSWYGYLRTPEALEPNVSQHRMGAAILTEHRMWSMGEWSSGLIYSANLYSNDSRLSNSVLLETTMDFDGKNAVFARGEYVVKSPADLDVPVPSPPTPDRFPIGSVVAGYVREVWSGRGPVAIGLGFAGILDVIPGSLGPWYATRTPGGFAIFLRARVAPRNGGPGMASMPGMS